MVREVRYLLNMIFVIWVGEVSSSLFVFCLNFLVISFIVNKGIINSSMDKVLLSIRW